MKTRPILFSAPMVRALLDGSKSQTRRNAKFPDDTTSVEWVVDKETVPTGLPYTGWVIDCSAPLSLPRKCPHGQPGDLLWVRETWAAADTMLYHYATDPPRYIAYKADLSARCFDPEGPCNVEYWNFDKLKWKPSIHMWRWASRITLEIVSVRVERLQNISEDDALAEGVSVHPDHHHKPRESIYSPVQAYRDLWESLNGPGSWDANPWVWVIEFKRLDTSKIND